ncbi:hypothetical protein VBQ45_03640 [Klebsiella pneumoniae]|nr:hypothetical protein [Klebsiella pneumoniae]
MTSKLTRERIELIANFHRAMTLPPSHAEIEELARIALAAMDGEPVAYTDERNLGYIDRGRETAYLWGKQNSEASDVALYRHAQPALVVPDEIKHRIGGLDWGWEGEFNRGWNACRAAMLQELKKSAGTEAICRSNENVQAVEVQSLTSINPAPDLVSLQKKAESIIGNYPGIPDCWCRTCRPVVLNDMRFVVCPDCGNKRCPRANDHRNSCTGSNEPGQEGSAYPDTTQEPKP